MYGKPGFASVMEYSHNIISGKTKAPTPKKQWNCTKRGKLHVCVDGYKHTLLHYVISLIDDNEEKNSPTPPPLSSITPPTAV